jgi:DnaK suppressor protein
MKSTSQHELTDRAREKLVERRTVLAKRRKLIEQNIRSATTEQMLEGTFATHLADEASDMIDAEVNLSDIGVIRQKIDEIDEAILRIDRGTYGRCIDCGKMIDPARLKTLPAAARCLRCETIDEMRTGREYEVR